MTVIKNVLYNGTYCFTSKDPILEEYADKLSKIATSPITKGLLVFEPTRVRSVLPEGRKGIYDIEFTVKLRTTDNVKKICLILNKATYIGPQEHTYTEEFIEL